MTEPTEEEASSILNVFLRAFNGARGTHYSLQHLQDNSVDGSCDFRLCNSRDGEIKIQLTTPASDSPDREALQLELRFCSILITAFERIRLQGVAVYVTYESLPTKRRIRDIIANKITELASNIPHEAIGFSATINREHLRHYSETLGRHIVDIKISCLPSSGAKPLISVAHYLCTLIPTSGEQAKQTYLKKLSRYANSAHDLILLINFPVNSYDSDEVEEMTSALGDLARDFREVWSICTVHSRTPRIHCIKY